ncbi:hypothetical protein [Bacteroides stercorirosoris]|uniref:hypothetical protein n=1 Tax=Bacteroides stercorirosoris TaxID=871324 RepID=UPI001FB193D5|nr:hypothetical protein [Bacteroides stercorirosoris]
MLKELLKLFVFAFFLIPIGKISAAVRTFEVPVSLLELFAPQADWQAGIIGNISGGGNVVVKIYYKESKTLVYQASLTSTSTTYSGVGVDTSVQILEAELLIIRMYGIVWILRLPFLLSKEKGRKLMGNFIVIYRMA